MVLYGLTIGSRFLSARDSNELRESVIKDTLGFTNWLILGGMVSKLTARALGGKELINNPVAQDGAKKGLKYGLKWLTKASVKSFDEVLLPNAKEITKNGKIAGYLYSGLVLGVGIAKLNIFITKQIQARKKASMKMNNQVNPKYDINYLSKMQGELSSVFKDFN